MLPHQLNSPQLLSIRKRCSLHRKPFRSEIFRDGILQDDAFTQPKEMLGAIEMEYFLNFSGNATSYESSSRLPQPNCSECFDRDDLKLDLVKNNSHQVCCVCNFTIFLMEAPV